MGVRRPTAGTATGTTATAVVAGAWTLRHRSRAFWKEAWAETREPSVEQRGKVRASSTTPFPLPSSPRSVVAPLASGGLRAPLPYY